MEVLSADQLEAVHLTSLRILEELGMEIMSERARGILGAAGAEVDPLTAPYASIEAWWRKRWPPRPPPSFWNPAIPRGAS